MRKSILLGILFLLNCHVGIAQFPYPIHKNKSIMSDNLEKSSIINEKNENILNVFKQYLDTLNTNGTTLDTNTKKLLTEAIKEFEELKNRINANIITYSHTSSDSMIHEYFNIIDKTYEGQLSSTKALNYRNTIDSIILNALHAIRAHAHSITRNNKYKSEPKSNDTNETDTCFRSKDSLIEYYDKNKNILNLARNYFHYLYLSENNPINKAWLLPLRSITHAEFLYFGKDNEQLKLLEQLNVQSDFGHSVSATSTIVSGIIPIEFRLGKPKCKDLTKGKYNFKRISFPIKFELGTTITQNLDTLAKEMNKINNKLLYGGLIQTRVSYPLINTNWKYFNGKGVAIHLPISYTANLEQFNKQNSTAKDILYFGEVATNLFINIDLIQGPKTETDASIYTNFKLAYLHGGETFKSYTPHLNSGSLTTLQMNAGLRIKDRFTIAVNWPIWASEKSVIINQAPTLALVLTP